MCDALPFDEDKTGECFSCEKHFSDVLAALKTVRIMHAGLDESEIHDALCNALLRAGIAFKREHRLGPRSRVDIWTGGIAVEVKKKRPATAALIAQVTKYLDHEEVKGLIVVLEKSVHVPGSINDKPVSVLSLNALWGIAL